MADEGLRAWRGHVVYLRQNASSGQPETGEHWVDDNAHQEGGKDKGAYGKQELGAALKPSPPATSGVVKYGHSRRIVHVLLFF